MITDSCNANCSFCIRKNLSTTSNCMQLSSALKVAAELSSAYNDAVLIITGGEPTLHKDFINIVEKCSSLFKYVVVNSNGSFSNDIAFFLKTMLSKNVYLQLSIDGTKNVHNKLRKANLYDCVFDKLDRFKSVFDHINLSTTVNRTNRLSITDLIKILNGYKFAYLKVSLEQKANPLTDDNLSYEEWNALVMDLINTAQFRLHTSKLFDFELWDRYIDTIDENDITRNCGYGSSKFYVDSNFNVLPCTCTETIIGNLITDSISDINDELEKQSNIVIDKTSVCYSCRYKKICNGGCPGYSEKVFGRIGMGDYRCPIVNAQIKNQC